MRVRPRVLLLTAVSFACVAAWTPALAAADMSPTLEARALLPADATWPAPFPGVPNAPEPVDELRLHRAQPALPDYSDFIVVKVPGLRKGWFAAVRLPPAPSAH